MGKLHVDAQDARHEEEIGDVGVGKDVDDFLLKTHLRPLYPNPLQGEYLIAAVHIHLFPIGLLQQIINILGHNIDNVFL